MAWPGRSKPPLIVCLGNTNSIEGELSATARARANLAVGVSASHPRAQVIATGGFGQFNRSTESHGLIISRYLEEKGIARARILPPLNSSGTHEDALMLRRIAIDADFKRIIVVTSQAHLPRARYLFQRACGEFDLFFEVAADVPGAESSLTEPYKLAREQATWVDPPLYGPDAERTAFPSDLYKNASDEQKHYDRISYLMVAGQFVLFGFGYSNNLWRGSIPTGPAFTLIAVLIVLLFLMYLRTATFANTSRDLMKAIELQWSPGFSLNARRRNFSRPLPTWIDRISMPAAMRLPLLRLAGMTHFFVTLGFTTTVAIVTALMVVGVLFSIWRLPQPVPPTGAAGTVEHQTQQVVPSPLKTAFQGAASATSAPPPVQAGAAPKHNTPRS